MKKNAFIKGVEKLVNPIDVGTIHFIQSFNNMLPLSIQKKMIRKSGEATPYMGFVVEPYSYFLFYEIKDMAKARSFLPEGFRLIKSKIYEDSEPKYYSIMGCFNAHTSGFWGMRVEFYVIAEDETTGMLTWIIADYDTNTITYDPKHGLSDPNAPGSLMTIDYNGTIHVDVKNLKGRRLNFSSNIKEGKMKSLDSRLWIEGNLSIAYGRLKADDDPGRFSLTFNPEEFKEGLQIPLANLDMTTNTWYPDLLGQVPDEALCFPYAQHLISDSPGHSSLYESESQLRKALETIDLDNAKPFSTKSFKKMMMVGGIMSMVSQTLLVLLLLLKYKKRH